MSEFDKEAEREKLRQKFAEEEKDRQSTQRMSELLLQGATMTNKHCDTCGDPIFRYDGQAFCPSCQAAGQQAQQQQVAEQGQQQAQEQATQQATQPQQSEPAEEPAETDADEETAVTESTAGATDQRPAQPDAGVRRAEPSRTDEPRGGRGTSDSRGDASTPEQARRGTDAYDTRDVRDARDARADASRLAGEFGEAEASIAETIRYFSDAAANTDDPARAREYLATVKEAAQALSALRR
ncbi:Sjogren's syndrome/scleroderma autoantigen 1 family protein [Haloarchaeobius sp. DFWS5]|uniref:Sjogren's syndrome/scleroderma autoantigen 1 family protein n=1 Tax=Haloarchaeobius sp. DFWS5 TaxID=3446114 RepID=UPI003EBF4B1D